MSRLTTKQRRARKRGRGGQTRWSLHSSLGAPPLALGYTPGGTAKVIRGSGSVIDFEDVVFDVKGAITITHFCIPGITDGFVPIH